MPALTEKKRFNQSTPTPIQEIQRGADGRTDFSELLRYLGDVSENLRNLNQFVFNEYNSHTINPSAHFSAWKNMRVRRKAYYNDTNNSTEVTFPASATKPFYVVTGDSRQVEIPGGYKLLYATSDVTCDLSTSGVGGLDTGTVAADTPYYFYAVDDDGDVGVIASENDPDTGPTGYNYGEWMYVGAVCTQPFAANFPAFRCSDGRMVFDRPIEIQTHTGDTNYTALTFDGLPNTAEFGVFSVQQTGTNIGALVMLSGTNTSGNFVLHQSQNTNGNKISGPLHDIPIFTPQTVYIFVSNAVNTGYAFFHGWVEDPSDWA